MIRTVHRVRGTSALGARRPGEQGPFGSYGGDGLDENDVQVDEEPSSTPGAGSDH